MEKLYNKISMILGVFSLFKKIGQNLSAKGYKEPILKL